MNLNTNIDMKNLGLTEEFLQESKIYKDLFIGRVSSQSKNLYKVITETGEIVAEISGRYHYSIKGISKYPAVGDFVMIDRTNNSWGNGVIHHTLFRKTYLHVKRQELKRTFKLSLQILIQSLFVCH